MLEADWHGRVLWEVQHPDHHHDGIRLRNGNVLLLCLAELPNSDIGVSFRTISTVIIIDRHTGQIIWKLGAPLMCGQHAPTLWPNGNLLIFDDGPHRVDHPMPFSRIAEPILWVGCGTGWRMAACGSHLVNMSNVRSRGG